MAGCTEVGIAWLARVQLRANPSTKLDSEELLPCCFRMLIAFTGWGSAPLGRGEGGGVSEAEAKPNTTYHQPEASREGGELRQTPR